MNDLKMLPMTFNSNSNVMPILKFIYASNLLALCFSLHEEVLNIKIMAALILFYHVFMSADLSVS